MKAGKSFFKLAFLAFFLAILPLAGALAQSKEILVFKLDGTTPQEENMVVPEPGERTRSFQVKLSSPPTGTVTVRVVVSGTAPLTVTAGSTLTFTSTNEPQRVSISEGTLEKDQTASIDFSASGYPTKKILYTVGGTTVTPPTPSAGIIDLSGLPGFSSLAAEEIIPTIITLLLTLIALVAFIGLIYSGFMYITAGGDAAKAEKARKNIVWSLTGIIIATLAYVIVTTVAGLFS